MTQIKFILLSFIFTYIFVSFVSPVNAACKAGEGDPWEPHPSPTTRVFWYNSANPQYDQSPKSGTVLDILSFNIQSGLSQTCAFNLEDQTVLMRNAHFYGLQEVDIGIDRRCNGCDQAKVAADGSGHTVLYLNTILTGKYGSALGSAYPVLEVRHYMIQQYYGEERGILAIRTSPNQLNGRKLWFLNTHYQFNGEYWKEKQAQETVAFASSLRNEFPQDLIIMTGDLYLVPGLAGYSVLETFFQNAWTVYNGSPNGGQTYPADWPANRYDHVWFRFPEGTQYSLDFTIVNTQVSDHRPIWAHFNFASGSTPHPTGCGVDLNLVQQGQKVWINEGRGVQGDFVIETYNSGNLNALRVNFDLILPAGSSIVSWWWFARVEPSYMDLPALSPGSSYMRGGFTLQYPDSTEFIVPQIIYKNTLC